MGILENWHEDNLRGLLDRGFSLSFKKSGSETSKPAEVLFVEHMDSFAQVILWISGECEAEVANSNEGIVFSRSENVHDDKEFRILMEDIIDRVG
ncbi:hypothetical protein AB0L88_19360 [Saccharopolyspora shandongensis]|uniref:hypothetical protein n=1 Tax=Saccharopolyspora shandongensis TaxID=418495 RepID=UPI003417A08D